MKERGRGTSQNKPLNEENRCSWNKATLPRILTRQEYCGDIVNFKTAKHYWDKRSHYVDKSQWQITENVQRIDVDIVMENIAEVLRKIARFSLSNKAEFEALVKSSLAKGQTDEVKKLQKRSA